MVQTLLQVGATSNSPGQHERTALYYALTNKQVNVARALLECPVLLLLLMIVVILQQKSRANSGSLRREDAATLVRLIEQRRNNPRCH